MAATGGLPHEDADSEEEEPANPQELVDKARALTSSAEGLYALVVALQSSQSAHTKSIRDLGELLSQPAAAATGIPANVPRVLAKIENSVSQSQKLLADVQNGPLQKMRAGRLKEFSTESDAYKSARQAQEAVESKLSALKAKGKPPKAKLQTLQTEEDAARKKSEITAKSAVNMSKLAEAEHAAGMHEVLRDMAFSQVCNDSFHFLPRCLIAARYASNVYARM